MGLSSILKKAVKVVDRVVSPFAGVSNNLIGSIAAPLAAGPAGLGGILTGGMPDSVAPLSLTARGSAVNNVGTLLTGMGYNNLGGALSFASQYLQTDSGDPVDPETGQIIIPQQGGGGMVPVAGSVARAGALIIGMGGRVLGLITGAGRRISVAKVAQIAKAFGIQTAAAALGVTAVEVAQAVMQDATKKRRRNRGITPRDMRVTGRTVNKLNRMHAKIAQIARKGVCHRR